MAASSTSATRATRAERPARVPSKKTKLNEIDKSRRIPENGALTPWLFVLPAIVVIVVFFIVPFINTLRLSFTDSTMLKAGDFIGIENYIKMFNDPRLQTALLNSSLYVVCVVPCMVILPLILAALVSGKGRVMAFFRTSFYMPVGHVLRHRRFDLDQLIG